MILLSASPFWRGAGVPVVFGGPGWVDGACRSAGPSKYDTRRSQSKIKSRPNAPSFGRQLRTWPQKKTRLNPSRIGCPARPPQQNVERLRTSNLFCPTNADPRQLTIFELVPHPGRRQLASPGGPSFAVPQREWPSRSSGSPTLILLRYHHRVVRDVGWRVCPQHMLVETLRSRGNPFGTAGSVVVRVRRGRSRSRVLPMRSGK